MNYDVMKLWVDALRSGKYEQGQWYLHSKINMFDGEQKDRFCCLGVLCELAIEAGVEVKKWYDNELFNTEYAGNSVAIPIVVMEWAGMKSNNGEINVPIYPPEPETDYNGETTLSSENDNSKSFKEIADMIEHYWEIL